MASKSFRDFYNDDANVSPTQRAMIEFEVELIGKLIEAREEKGMTQAQLAEAAGVKQCRQWHDSRVSRPHRKSTRSSKCLHLWATSSPLCPQRKALAQLK